MNDVLRYPGLNLSFRKRQIRNMCPEPGHQTLHVRLDQGLHTSEVPWFDVGIAHSHLEGLQSVNRRLSAYFTGTHEPVREK